MNDMADRNKTKAELLSELAKLRQEVAQLKAIGADCQVSKQSGPEQSEETVHYERSLLRGVIDSIPDLIFYQDTNNVYLGCNKAFEEFAGRPESELIGRADSEIFGPEADKFFRTRDWPMLAEGQSHHNEKWVDYPDGRRRLFDILKMPFYDSNGNLLGLIGISHDITERKRAEATLAKWANELETVARVSAAASTILEAAKLLHVVANLTKSSFGLYHVHIYLLNEAGDMLKLVAGAGKVGRQMVAQGWSIPLTREQSLVARAARTRQGVIENDAQKAPDWLPNPLLPDTRSELAVPLIVGDHVLGVLDVQSDELGHFTEEDVRIQTTLAGQIAVALQNAKSYEQSRVALAETRMLYDISARLNTAVSLEEALKAAISPSIAGGASSAGVWLFDFDAAGNPEWMEFAATWVREGEPLMPIGTRLRLIDFPSHKIWINDSGQSTFISNIDSDERVDAHMQATFTQVGVRAVAFMPLTIGSRWIGATIISWQTPHVFSTSEQQLYQSIAIQTAVAIENRRLFAQTQTTLEALQESQQFYQSLVDLMPQKLLRKDRQGRTTFANKAHLDSVGLTLAEVLGKTNYDLYPKEDADRYTADDEYLMTTEEIIHVVEPHWETAINQTLYVEAIKHPVRDTSGNVVGMQIIYWDVTDRKQAEEALAQERNLLRTLIDNLPDAIYVKDTAGRHLIANQSILQGLGLTSEEVIGKTDLDLYPSEMAQQWYADDMAIMQSGQPLIDREEVALEGNKSVGWNLTTKIPLRDSQGKVIGLVGMTRNISERKLTEEALRQSEVRYRTLAQNLPIGIYRNTPGPRGKFLTVNEAMAHMFGYASPEELRQYSPIDLYLDPAQRKVFSDKLLAQGRVINEEMEFKRKDGTPVWVAMTATAVRDETGQVAYFDGLIEDMTERKLAEEALRASEERFALAVAGTQDGIWDWDIKNSTLYWSPRLKEMLGYNPDEFKIDFDIFASLLHPEDAKTTNAALEAHLNQRTPYDVEQRLRGKSGEYIWCRVRGQAIWDEAGNPLRMTGSTIDITAEKEAVAERERLLAEVQAAYRQYIQREWENFLGEQHQEGWRIEHQHKAAASLPTEELATLQAEVIHEGKAKFTTRRNGDPTQLTMVAPIALRGQVIGTLSLQDVDPDRRWTAEEKALVETVSEQLALTVENLRLIDNTQKRAMREQLTRQITDKMRTAPDIDLIVQTGLAELAKALNISRAYVKLTTKSEDE